MTMSTAEVRVSISSESDIVTARRQAREMAARLGFSETDQTLVATAISEVARNIVLYAGRGGVVIDLVSRPHGHGLRVSATDSGPGIADVDRAMEDGFSTGNSLGLGLPGARRLMDEFTLTSRPGEGTQVVMVKWLRRFSPTGP
jgi:serine/threonine-protein kinase RsbT